MASHSRPAQPLSRPSQKEKAHSFLLSVQHSHGWTMTPTLSRTNSAAISAERSLRPSAQRYSIATVRPSGRIVRAMVDLEHVLHGRASRARA
jgi:hypothetical protein